MEQIGLEFEVCPAKGEEVITKTNPEDIVTELAGQKAREVAASIIKYNEDNKELTTPSDIMVIGADTIVVSDDTIMGKPGDEDEAIAMLQSLSGRAHSVYTGVSVVIIAESGRTGEFSFYEKTDVYFKEMSIEEISRYVATGDPLDKAGAYGIQGSCAIYIEKIDGDYNNVVGFPLARFYSELKRVGINIFE